MIETVNVPLSKLVPWDGNVRRTGVTEGIVELAASIAAHGLLQTPVVPKAKGGKYAVIAGQRRLLALRLLVEQGTIEADTQIACRLAAAKSDSGELSLAENVVRLAMHPADQFEAFRDLADRGLEAASIAARFGVSEMTVLKRLKLGRLSPAILEAYRSGDIGLEEAQAFAISDDHELQERVYAELPDWNRSASVIRRHLTAGETPASDKRVLFVGLAAYKAAGGDVRRDLFDDRDSGTILDSALLDRLVADKLATLAGDVRAEGWAWVETVSDFDRSVLADYRRIYAERVLLSAEDQAERDSLAEEYDALADSDEADAEHDATLSRLAAIEQRLDELDERETFWSDDARASAGAIVFVAHGGAAGVERGLVRPGDEPSKASEEQSDEERKPAGLSAALIEDLTSRRTVALRVAMAGRPDIALVATVHALALPVFYPYERDRSCLQLRLTASPVERAILNPDADRALNADADTEMRWSRLIPKSVEGFWDWCLAQPQDNLLALLAFVAGRSIDAVQRKSERPDSDRIVHAGTLAKALGFDMAAWFTPDSETYFGRITSAQIVESLCEARQTDAAPSWLKMKKAELAALAAREVAGTGWLPAVLRAEDKAA